jgi:hypothetical protein
VFTLIIILFHGSMVSVHSVPGFESLDACHKAANTTIKWTKPRSTYEPLAYCVRKE